MASKSLKWIGGIMQFAEYEKPPRATKEMIDAFEKKNELPDKVYKKALTAPTLNKPAKTKFKSKDIFIEQQRLEK